MKEQFGTTTPIYNKLFYKICREQKAIYENVGALKETKPVAYQNTIDSNAGKLWDIVIEPAS